MSDERIDLAALAAEADRRKYTYWVGTTPEQLLALVAAVRAAKALNDTPASVNNWKALDAALAPFTDSAEEK